MIASVEKQNKIVSALGEKKNHLQKTLPLPNFFKFKLNGCSLIDTDICFIRNNTTILIPSWVLHCLRNAFYTNKNSFNYIQNIEQYTTTCNDKISLKKLVNYHTYHTGLINPKFHT